MTASSSLSRALLALPLFAALGLAIPAFADSPPRASAQAEEAPSGEDLFVSNCAKCHAKDGSGDTKMGDKFRNDGKNMPDLRGSDIDRAATHAAIADGIPKTPMKGYAKKLTAEELESLTTYTLSLRRADKAE